MSGPDDNFCARTDAVLAVHLDGDLEPGPALDREPFGYGFVSDDSLHAHLRDCSTCQQALQRARRLDAALASTAGRAVAEQLDESASASIKELGDSWLRNAWIKTNASGSDTDGDTVSGSRAFGSRAFGSTASGSTTNGRAVSIKTVAIGIAAAGIMISSWLRSPGGPDVRRTSAAATIAASEPHVATAGSYAEEVEPTQATPPDALPSSLAHHMHAARERSLRQSSGRQRNGRQSDSAGAQTGALPALPVDGTPSALAERITDSGLETADRVVAAKMLMQATRPGSSAARHATDQMLLAVASCGDRTDREVAVHTEVLRLLNAHGPMLVRIEHRLASIPNGIGVAEAGQGDRQQLSRVALAAVVVAARMDQGRIDSALRRALRRNPHIADAIASALRCGVRLKSGSDLLLACWRDQVAVGNEDNTARWAEFWFRGQAQSTFAALPKFLQNSRSAHERVRCLLAMGCVGDNSTVPSLLRGLRSPRREEACAAAVGLANLPHHVLITLVPKARSGAGTGSPLETAWLRAALARASLPQAQRWLRSLTLNKTQLRLLRRGPLARFAECALWFRSGALVAD